MTQTPFIDIDNRITKAQLRRMHLKSGEASDRELIEAVTAFLKSSEVS